MCDLLAGSNLRTSVQLDGSQLFGPVARSRKRHRLQLATVLVLSIILIKLAHLKAATNEGTEREEKQQQQQQQQNECSDCKLVASSLDELLRRPRQMDAYGQLSDRLDLDKLNKLVCKELVSDSQRERCRNFYLRHQESVRRWKEVSALAPRNKLISFHDLICIRGLKMCCPSESFGPKCSKCAKCKSNERCHGAGTRLGNGTCLCKWGYAGADCASCQAGFYQLELGSAGSVAAKDFSSNNNNNNNNSMSASSIACKPCHKSCQFCRAPGPDGCEVCRKGYVWHAGVGCFDVDECLESGNSVCGPNTFCVNTEGSYFCYECDRACNGCHGDGPDMCLKCADGYKLDKANTCVATRKTVLPPEANYYRYAIYLGLCLCTCIILNNSVLLASFVGLCVALYISASEYVMSGQPGAQNEPDAAAAAASNNLATKLALGASQGLTNLAHLGL